MTFLKIHKVGYIAPNLKLGAIAFKKFEDHFFTTSEGTKFKKYIEAAKKDDYTEFLKDHPHKVVATAETASHTPPADVKAEASHTQAASATVKTEATELAEEASKFKWTTGKKWTAGVAAAAAVAGGVTWAVKHNRKDKSAEAEQSAAR